MKLKIVYKIYGFGFKVDQRDIFFSQTDLIPSPLDCPDFETEQDAEEWLLQQDVKSDIGMEKYFFILKSFKSGAKDKLDTTID